jgi:hypothetical protein
VSRRVTRLKALGLVDHVEGRWAFETPKPPKGGPWVRPVNLYARRETTEGDGMRFG